MIRHLPAALALCLLHLPAQGPAFVPKRPVMVSLSIDGVDELQRQLPDTRVGRLLADADVRAATDAVIDFSRRQVLRSDALADAVLDLPADGGGNIEPWLLTSVLMRNDDPMRLLARYPAHELRSFRMLALAPPTAEQVFPLPDFVYATACRPQFEGRWTAGFEQRARRVATSPWFTRDETCKVSGLPTYRFRLSEQVPEDEWFDRSDYSHWMMHLPGRFFEGSGDPTELGEVGTQPTADVPGAALHLDLQAYVGMFSQLGGGVPAEFSALGFDRLKSFDWNVRFVDDLLLDEVSITLDGEPGGLVKAVLHGSAALPAQALPDGAIAQLRAALDLRTLAEVLPVLDLPELPDDMLDELLAALDGGISVACCAPAPGGLIPRIYATLGIADRQAFDAVLAKLLNRAENLPLQQVTYDGVECTVLRVPELPNGVQPAWCVHDGKLHVAESGRSLRALLKAQQAGVVAMDVGEAPVAEGPGEIVAGLDLRFDEAELYRCYHELWLPLFELSGGAGSLRPAITHADLPEPDVIAEHCGKSRGVLRRDGDVWRLQHLGPLGGPELACLLMAWGPMLTSSMVDYTADSLARHLAVARVAKVRDALQTFREREQRWPNDLTELFAAEKLPADALFVPGDDLAETFPLADGSEARTSFRYFAEPVHYTTNGEDPNMLLIEIRPALWHRTVLNTKGEMPELYVDDAQRPIDEFRPGDGTARDDLRDDEAPAAQRDPARAEPERGGGER